MPSWAITWSNIFWHALAACLLAAILRRLHFGGAWLAALLFALHPVGVEAVAWISEQKSTLSAVFYLASALVYLDFDRTRRRSRYLPAFALFLCALLTKTVTATLPAALLVVFWWQRGAVSWRGTRVRWRRGSRWASLPACSPRGWSDATSARPALISPCPSLPAPSWPPRDLLLRRQAHLARPPGVHLSALDGGSLRLVAIPVPRRRSGGGRGAGCARPAAGAGRWPRFCYFAGTLFPALGFFNVFPFLYS